jgi:hypothetical protein
VSANELTLASDYGAVMNNANAPRFVVATRLSTGTLRVALFGASVDSGSLTHFDEKDAGAGSSIDLTHIGYGGFATSMITDKGYVSVDFWRVSQKGQISAAGDSGARFEPAVETTIVGVGPKNREGVATAIRTPDGKLKLIVWENDERGDGVQKTFYKLETGLRRPQPRPGRAADRGVRAVEAHAPPHHDRRRLQRDERDVRTPHSRQQI